MKALRLVTGQLSKNFTLISTALLTFVLCLGVGLLISAIVNSVLLRHFPLPTPDQLESMFDAKARPLWDLRYVICDLTESARGHFRSHHAQKGPVPEGMSGGSIPQQNRKSQI
jgi:hypothetical protein